MEHTDPQEQISSIFRPPLSKDEMRQHVVTTALILTRQLHFIFCRPNDETAEAQSLLLGLSDAAAINSAGLAPAEIGLTYEKVRTTALAQEMERAYDFAYLGMHTHAHDLNSESGLSWVSRVLYDLASSSFVMEADQYMPCKSAVQALLDICETAQARIILEDQMGWIDDSFMSWHVPEETLQGKLTFRQMSLLSGITEQSLRTLASPNRKNRLITISEGRNAYIESKTAREWLMNRSRYVTLFNIDSQGANIDLVGEEFKSIGTLFWRLSQRAHFLIGSEEGDRFRSEIDALDPMLLTDFNGNAVLDLEYNSRHTNEMFVRQLAKCLRLPGDEMVLVVQHLCAREELEQTERRLLEARNKRAR